MKTKTIDKIGFAPRCRCCPSQWPLFALFFVVLGLLPPLSMTSCRSSSSLHVLLLLPTSFFIELTGGILLPRPPPQEDEARRRGVYTFGNHTTYSLSSPPLVVQVQVLIFKSKDKTFLSWKIMAKCISWYDTKDNILTPVHIMDSIRKIYFIFPLAVPRKIAAHMVFSYTTHIHPTVVNIHYDGCLMASICDYI